MKGVAVTLPRLTGLLALLALAFATIGADAVPDASDPALPEVTDTRPRDLPENAGMLRTFGPGEELVYAVKFGPIRAGTATLSVVGVEWANGGRCYRLKSTASSRRSSTWTISPSRGWTSRSSSAAATSVS
jgi:hypothetical protein